jgi:hypothetical protein
MSAYTDALMRLQDAAGSLIFNAVEEPNRVIVQLDDYTALVQAAADALNAEKREKGRQRQLTLLEVRHDHAH